MSKDTNDVLRWMRLAEEIDEEPETSEPEEMEEPKSKKTSGKLTKETVLNWFEENPNPDEDAVKDWCDEMDCDEDDVEEIIYKIVTDHAKMLKKEREKGQK